MDPIRNSAFLPSIAEFLVNDFVTAFIAGAVLAFVMHSSVAVILMCVTLVSVGAIPAAAGVSLVLGANLGSAIIPVWLSRGMNNVARRVPLANLSVRGTGAILALFAVNNFGLLPYLGSATSAQTLINTHILFNLLLLVVLIVCNRIEAPFKQLLPDAIEAHEDQAPIYRTVLDETVLDKPHLAIPILKREVLRMVQLVETMAIPIMDIYANFDADRSVSVIAQDAHVNKALDDIRRYSAALQNGDLSKRDFKLVGGLTEYAIAVETAGDIVAKRLLPLAKEKHKSGVKFSDNGESELVNMHEKILSNISLAVNVLISDDIESARLLLEEKQEMARLERKSRKRHLKRLSKGIQISFESSDIHLETAGSLRDFNSYVASVAYPILYRGGQLLETRLIEQENDDVDIRQR